MEVVLAVITLATAVKDMVELADKIHASFEKVADNLQNAQVLASEIKQTINELKEFCEQHGATLENDKALRGALLEVIAKLRLFDSNIVPLIASPSSSPRLLGRVKGGFKAWRNNDRIDASIRQLKEEVKKCQLNFMMMSVARMQVKLNQMDRSTSEGLRIIQQGVSNLRITRNTVSYARDFSSSSRPKVIEASNQSILAFAQTSSSTSAPMWKTPSAIQEQIIQDSYLKGQIDSIATSLSKIPSLHTTRSIEPLKHYASPYTQSLASTVCTTWRDPERLHRDVVMQALEMRKTMENLSTSTSIQAGASDLIKLSIGLYDLNMLEEAVKMSKWAVSLYQILVCTDKVTYSPHLINSLKCLWFYNDYAGNDDGALDAIEKAVRISEGLQTATTLVGIRVQHCSVLSAYAKALSDTKDHKRAIELAEQSVQLMEDINGVHFLPSSYEDADGTVQQNHLSLTQLYRVSPSDLAIAEYARALQVLSNCLIADGQQQESLDVKLRALLIFYDMPLSLAKDMEIELAVVLYELVTQDCSLLLPAEKVLEYVEDCVKIYRSYAELNPSIYSRPLCNALQEKAGVLTTLNRDSDALEVWKEIANIAQKMMQDQQRYAGALNQVSSTLRRLKRHEEAVSVRTQSVLAYEAINNTATASQAHGYYSLCVDYQFAMRFPEAVNAAKNAVKRYRVLAFAEPDRWTRDIGGALSELANCLLSAGDLEAALNEGHESMQIFESHIKTNPACIGSYKYCLEINIGVALTVNNERRAIERMDDILRHMRALAIGFPEELSFQLVDAEMQRGYNLYRFDHVQEALKCMEELTAKCEAEEHPHVDKEDLTNLHIRALITYASILDNLGHTDLALALIRKGTDIGKQFSATSPKLTGQTVRAMYRQARLLVKLGRYDEASVVAEGTLKFNRETQTDNLSYLVGTLHAVGLAADRIHAYGRVVEVSQETVNICKSADFVEYCQNDYPRSACFLSRSLQQLSSGHANWGNFKLGLQYGQEAVDNAKTLRANPLIASEEVDQFYMEANAHLGAMYLANNRINEARMTLEETRTYYIERVKARPGKSGNLISTLRQLGIIYCSEGRHDEGRAVAQEANRYLDHLTEVSPGLHKLVYIHVRHELTTPSLQILNRIKEVLPCDHQIDLSF